MVTVVPLESLTSPSDLSQHAWLIVDIPTGGGSKRGRTLGVGSTQYTLIDDLVIEINK